MLYKNKKGGTKDTMANEYSKILLKGTASAYNALVQKNTNALYFLTDTKQVYLGEELLSQAVIVVETRPIDPLVGVVYYCQDTEKVETYSSDVWVTLAYAPATSIDNTSDDEHYATAKAVYDYIQNAVGGIDNAEVIEARGEFGKLADRLDNMDSKIADLLYEAINITSFSNNVGTVEKGSTISAVTLSWATNKKPTTLALDGSAIDTSLKTTSLTGLSITANKSYSLKATDDRNATSTKTTSITFLNGVYCGAAEVPALYDSTFILGFTRALQSSRSKTFTADGGASGSGKHLWFCSPTSYGTCKFNVGGFDGGFTKVSTIMFTNASGFTESYDIWMSDNDGLGSTTVKVS